MRIIFIFLFLISISVADKYKIVPFQKVPGIYYHDIGVLKVNANHPVKIATFLDMNLIAEKLNVFQNITTQFQDIDSKKTGNGCNPPLKFPKIEELHSLIQNLTGLPPPKDNETQEIYQNSTNPCYLSEDERQIIISKIKSQKFDPEFNQNSIISLTAAMNQNTDSEELNPTNIMKKFDELLNGIKDMEKCYFQTKFFQFINPKFEKFVNQLEMLKVAIRELSNSTVPDAIVKPEQLLKELSNIKNDVNFPKDLIFTHNLTNAYMKSLTSLSSYTLYSQNETLIFVISFELFFKTENQFYRLVPQPVPLKEDFYAYIEPTKKYLVLNTEEQTYQLMDFMENCKFDFETGDTNIFFCKISNLQKSSVKDNPCEMHLKNDGRNVNDTCDERLIRINKPILHRLEYTNEWLFVHPDEKNPVQISCSSSSTSDINFGTNKIGKLQLVENCTIISDNPDMKFETNFENNKFEEFVPAYEITKNCCTDVIWSQLDLSLTNAVNFDQLIWESARLSDMNSYYNLYKTKFALFYIALPIAATVSLGFLVYFMIVCTRNRVLP